MSAPYDCPSCGGELEDAGAENAWQCERCGELVVESISKRRERVRQFYRRATGQQWGGLHD